LRLREFIYDYDKAFFSTPLSDLRCILPQKLGYKTTWSQRIRDILSRHRAEANCAEMTGSVKVGPNLIAGQEAWLPLRQLPVMFISDRDNVVSYCNTFYGTRSILSRSLRIEIETACKNVENYIDDRVCIFPRCSHIEK
jgi:hypothetical protein